MGNNAHYSFIVLGFMIFEYISFILFPRKEIFVFGIKLWNYKLKRDEIPKNTHKNLNMRTIEYNAINNNRIILFRESTKSFWKDRLKDRMNSRSDVSIKGKCIINNDSIEISFYAPISLFLCFLSHLIVSIFYFDGGYFMIAGLVLTIVVYFIIFAATQRNSRKLISYLYDQIDLTNESEEF